MKIRVAKETRHANLSTITFASTMAKEETLMTLNLADGTKAATDFSGLATVLHGCGWMAVNC